MGEAKNQHYIPQAYLKNFAIRSKGKNHYVYVRFKGEKFHEANIRNICSENYFYALADSNSRNPNQFENYYADNIDCLYPEVTSIICNDSLTTITQEQRRKILRGVLNLYFRTPKFLRYYQEHIQILEKALDDYHLGKTEKHFIDFFARKIDLRTIDVSEFKQNREQKGKQLFLIQHLKMFEDFVAFKMNAGIGVSKIEDNSEYITGDNPVIIRNSKGFLFNIFASDNVIYLPINKKYLITITPQKEESLEGTFNRISASFDDVIGINHDIVKNSEKWIIGSKDGIHNHLDGVDSIENDKQIGLNTFERIQKKGILMKQLDEVLSENDGKLTPQVIQKIIQISKEDVMQDDVNMKRYISELKSKGFIK